jgi:putative two-component system response regulator
MRSVLIADDQYINRVILAEVFQDECEILEAVNGREVLEQVRERDGDISLVLLDLMMPELDGFAVLEELGKKGYLSRMPVIIITGEESKLSKKHGFELGVTDFFCKPYDTTIIRKRAWNAIELYEHKNRLEETVKKQAKRILEDNIQLMEMLGTVVEYHNLESGNHIQRVRELSRLLAREMGLSEKEIDIVATASVLHDVGKVAITDTILLKPGKLTAEEFAVIETHTVRGSEMIESIRDWQKNEYFICGHDISRSHHEKWNGTGYPDKLKGEEIPLSARIVALADVYDALASKRVYKEAFLPEKCYEIIISESGTHFDPACVEAFKRVSNEFERMIRELI